MTTADGSRADMTSPALHPGLELDELTTERLVTGAVGPDDAPPAYAPVVQLLDAAAGPAQDRELEGESDVRAMFARERPAPSAAEPAPVAARPPRRARTAKVVAVALVGTLALTGGAAAAATGHLPAPLQGAVHGMLEPLGITIPDAPPPAVPSSTDDGTGNAPPDGQDPGGAVTTIATDPDVTGPAKGPAVCAEASDGTCQAGQHGGAGQAPGDPGATGGPGADPTTGRPADPGNPDPGPVVPTTGPPTAPPAGPPVVPPSTQPAAPPSTVPAAPTAPPSTQPSGPPASIPGDDRKPAGGPASPAG